ncbi:MAG: GNAT family N-acetyltransferase; N-acetyltransferase [Actinomycetota bacterium]
MPHPYWPFFDLRVVTPVLELVPLDDDTATRLARLAAEGIHDPSTMPFAFPWTDAPSPEMERNALRFHWRNRAELTPANWALNFGVVVDGELVGSTGMGAVDFPDRRTFETGSWLGRRFQGRGLGKEMRVATLQLGFEGFGARLATTHAFHDNAASLGVTRSLGYTHTAHERKMRRDTEDESMAFEMTAGHFAEHVRRADIRLLGVEPCLPVLGLA